MDFSRMQERARAVRAQYAAVEAETYGRSWSTEEVMLGFLGDVGDLAKLVQGKASSTRVREVAPGSSEPPRVWCTPFMRKG